MEKHLIIARYREDAGWLKNIDFPIFLYDKSYPAHIAGLNPHITQQTLPNIGRESHTYNQYILDHYDNLPDVCIFSQCHPFDHVENFVDIINANSIDEMWEENLKQYPNSPIRHDGFLGLGKYSHLNLKAQRGEEDFWWLKFKTKDVYTRLFSDPLPDDFHIAHGCIMVVERDNILSNPRSLYEKMLTLHENFNFPAFDWSNETSVAFEYLWTLIFKKDEKTIASGPHIGSQDWLI